MAYRTGTAAGTTADVESFTTPTPITPGAGGTDAGVAWVITIDALTQFEDSAGNTWNAAGTPMPFTMTGSGVTFYLNLYWAQNLISTPTTYTAKTGTSFSQFVIIVQIFSGRTTSGALLDGLPVTYLDEAFLQNHAGPQVTTGAAAGDDISGICCDQGNTQEAFTAGGASNPEGWQIGSQAIGTTPAPSDYAPAMAQYLQNVAALTTYQSAWKTSIYVDGGGAVVALKAAASSSLQASLGAVAGFSAASALAGSVTLVAPLYTGHGGILTGDFWNGTAPPIAGDTVYYDMTFITILPDGEIVSTSNNCQAAVQFADQSGNVHQGLVVITPTPVSYLSAGAGLTASLTNVTPLQAVLGAVTGFAGTLPIGFNAVLGAISGMTARIFATTPLVASLGAPAGVAGTITVQALFQAALGAISGLAPTITVGAAFRAALGAVSSMVSTITAGAAFKAQLGAVTVLQAAITTTVALRAALGAIAGMQPLITTSIVLRAALSAVASVAARLTTTIPLQMLISAVSGMRAPLITSVRFLSSLGSTPAIQAPLTTEINLLARLGAVESMTAVVGTTPLRAQLGAAATLDPEFTYTGSPVGVWPFDPDLVVGECRHETPRFRQIGVSEQRVLSFDFSSDLDCAAGEHLYGVIEVQISVLGDVTETATPNLLAGLAAYDPTFRIVSQPVSGGAVAGVSYYLVVTAPTTNPEKVLMRTAILPIEGSD